MNVLAKRLEVAPLGQLVPPVEQPLAGQVPGRPVVELDQVGQGVDLHDGQQFRPLLVIVADVLQGLAQSVHVGGRLGLGHDDRHAVDEEHDVGADVGGSAVAERELVGDVECVGLDVCRVEQPDVPLALLGRDEHGLEPLEVFPGVKVALDVRLDPDQPLEDVLGSQVIHDSGVEPLELIDENGIEDRARHPAPQVHGLLGREVGPAGVDCVADEGFLNGPFLATEGGGDNAGRVIRRLGSGSGSRLSFNLSPPCSQRSRPRASV